MAPSKQHRSFIFLWTQLGLYNWVGHLILKSTTKAHHRPQSTRAMSLSPQNTGHNIIILYTILKWTTNSDYIPWPETRLPKHATISNANTQMAYGTKASFNLPLLHRRITSCLAYHNIPIRISGQIKGIVRRPTWIRFNSISSCLPFQLYKLDWTLHNVLQYDECHSL